MSDDIIIVEPGQPDIVVVSQPAPAGVVVQRENNTTVVEVVTGAPAAIDLRPPLAPEYDIKDGGQTGPQGPQGPPGPPGGAQYIHEQMNPADTWAIQHDLDKLPPVTVIDTAGTKVYGNVDYIDTNNVVLTFSAPFAGRAILGG